MTLIYFALLLKALPNISVALSASFLPTFDLRTDIRLLV
jgi:hypothetical protein